MTDKDWRNSEEYKVWKNGAEAKDGAPAVKGIVRRRLEKLDELLSSGEWISNTRMLEEINELYLDAPNAECYSSPTVPHKLVEAKEGSREKFESALSLMFAGTVRQDRLTINRILRLVGKEYIFERKDNGEGTEGSYRYNTKYSIFEKHSINDNDFIDYELFRSDTAKKEKSQEQSKDDNVDAHNEDVSNHIENLDFPTIQAMERLTKAISELRRIRDINNYYVSNLLDKAYAVYDAKHEGWEKELLRVLINAYDVASHPDSNFDKSLLFQIRSMLILAKEGNSDYSDILTLLRKQHEELLLLDSIPAGLDEAYILYLIRHFVFETYDVEGMIKELESYYNSCLNQGKIVLDNNLYFALKCLCYKGPQKWEYNGPLLSCVNKLISFFFSIIEAGFYSTGMLVSLFFIKLNLEKAKKGEEPITEDEIIQLYIDSGWEHPVFQL